MPEHATITRPRTAPVHPRRVSGPTRRPVPVGPPVRGRTGAFERLSRIPDHRVVDRLLRGRACIWVIGIMLGGIVAMQVSLLRLNSGISRAVATQSTLERQNAGMQAQIAELTAGDKIRAAAAAEHMVDPQAGDTRFLTARPSDVNRAIHRFKPPSDTARMIMDLNGVLPAAGIVAPATVAGVAATPPPPPAATTTTVAPLPTPVATVSPPPVQTAVPTATAMPTVAADPATATQG